MTPSSEYKLNMRTEFWKDMDTFSDFPGGGKFLRLMFWRRPSLYSLLIYV